MQRPIKKYYLVTFLPSFWTLCWLVPASFFSGFNILFIWNLKAYKRVAEDTLYGVLNGDFDLLLPFEMWYDAYDERFVCYTSAVEKHAEKFKNEFMAIHNMSDLAENKELITATGNWEWFEIRANKMLFPKASSFVQRWIDFYGLDDRIISFEYSGLGPGTHLLTHHGPTNLRVTIQVPIYLPERGSAEGQCMGLYFGKDENSSNVETNDEILQVWQDGEMFLFNDGYRHSAYNYMREKRSLVMIMIWNPTSYSWWPWRTRYDKCPDIVPGLLRCEKTCASRMRILNQKEDIEGCLERCESELWSSEYHDCMVDEPKGRGLNCEHLLQYELPIFNESDRWREVPDLPENKLAGWICEILGFLHIFEILELIYFQEDSWIRSWDWHLGKNCPSRP